MIEAILFVASSIPILWISIPSLRTPLSHGFFRFFAWEMILGAFVINLHAWFQNPFSGHQIISWVLLIAALILIVNGVYLLRTVGKPTDPLEATTHLVTRGIYRYIRHPLYASLFYLVWGIFLSPLPCS